MKEGIIYPKSRIECYDTMEGESLEERLRKMIAGKEPIQATAKIGYTDRKDGVHQEYDIRTDRFEMALIAANHVHASAYAARMQQDGFVQDDTGKWVPKPQEQVVTTTE